MSASSDSESTTTRGEPAAQTVDPRSSTVLLPLPGTAAAPEPGAPATDRAPAATETRLGSPGAPSLPPAGGDPGDTAERASSSGRRSATFPPGSTIGRFVVRKELGRGGVGVVLEAYDPTLDRVVALKLLIAGRDASEQQLVRFLREAKAASGLVHPHIVPVHDLGEVDGRVFFAMERIEGQSLGDLLEAEGTLPPRRAFEIARAVALALHHAHARGIVHRDVKPENVLIDQRGHAYLTDFGLARDLGLDARLTQTGVFVGTPAYASPEQITGRPVDARTDVYSLGATLFEAITGHPPFEAESFATLAWRIANEAARDLRQLAPVASDVEAIVATCLQKEPDQRYASAEALAADLERFLRGEAVRARTAGPLDRLLRSARRNLARVAAGALVLGLAVASATYALTVRTELTRSEALSRTLEASLERTAQRFSRETERRAVLGSLVGEQGSEERIATITSALLIDPSWWEGLCDRATLRRRLAAERRRAGDLAGAHRAAHEASQDAQAAQLLSAPARAPLLFLEAEIARRDLRDPVATRRLLETLAGLLDGGPWADSARARLAADRGEPEAALAAIAQAAEAAPRLAPLRALEAELRRRAGDLPGAQAALEALGPSAGWEDPEPLVARALVAEASGEPGFALEDLDRALALDPLDPAARRERGRLRLLRGELARATADLDRALALCPQDPGALVLRILARNRIGLARGASEDLNALERLGVQLPEPARAYLLGDAGSDVDLDAPVRKRPPGGK